MTHVGFKGGVAQTNRGFSGGVWGDCPVEKFVQNGEGLFVKDDMIGLSAHTANSADDTIQTGAARYRAFTDLGGTIAALDTEVGGVVRVSGDGTDNDGATVQSENVLGVVTDTAGSNKELWWECRFRINSIAAQSLFIGLAQEGLTTNADGVFADDATGIAAIDALGWRVVEGDPDGMDAVHRISSGSEVVVGSAQTIAVDTWYKVGGYYDGTNYYWTFNGVQVGGGVDGGDSTMPDGEELCFTVSHKNGTAAARNLDIDWWAFAQRF